MSSTDDLIAELLAGQPCASCGEPAAQPGEPCASCGALPAVTAPELAEALQAAPLAVAEIEAQRAIAEGYQQLDAAIARIHDADRIRLTARLELARDEAQQALEQAKRDQVPLQAPLRKARREAGKAAAELEAAKAGHAELARAEELARRYRHGLQAETDAALKLAEAGRVLGRYQTAHADAQTCLRQAEAAAHAAAARASQAEAARDHAVKMLADPGRVGYGAEAITAGLMRLLAGGNLNEAEMLIAGTLAGWACSLTGALDGLQDSARAAVLAEQQAERDAKPLQIGEGPDGQLLAAPNPRHAGNPRPWDPPRQVPGQLPPGTVPEPPLAGGFGTW